MKVCSGSVSVRVPFRDARNRQFDDEGIWTASDG